MSSSGKKGNASFKEASRWANKLTDDSIKEIKQSGKHWNYSECRDNPTTYSVQTQQPSLFNKECRGRDSKGFREIGMLEEINQLRRTHPHCMSSEDTPFTKTWVNKCVRGASTSLKSSMTAVFCRRGLTGGTKATWLENISAMEIIVSWSSRGQMVALNSKARWASLQWTAHLQTAVRVDWQITPQKKLKFFLKK